MKKYKLKKLLKLLDEYRVDYRNEIWMEGLEPHLKKIFSKINE